jgi:hypothetical protein
MKVGVPYFTSLVVNHFGRCVSCTEVSTTLQYLDSIHWTQHYACLVTSLRQVMMMCQLLYHYVHHPIFIIVELMQSEILLPYMSSLNVEVSLDVCSM